MYPNYEYFLKVGLIMIEERLNYLSILFMENKKFLLYEAVIKEYRAKKGGKMYYRGISGR